SESFFCATMSGTSFESPKRKTRREINVEYRKRKKEKDKALQDEIKILQNELSSAQGQILILKEEILRLSKEIRILQQKNILLQNEHILDEQMTCDLVEKPNDSSEKLEKLLEEKSIKRYDFSQFSNLKIIGRGGSAIVYTGVHKGEQYALKTLNNLYMDEKIMLQYADEVTCHSLFHFGFSTSKLINLTINSLHLAQTSF
ncbi:24549_t:CDS:2, partial [Racocetra persica]